MKYTITPSEKPPLGLLGGSVHDWDRGKDPFARECMPPEFQDRFPNKPAATGWLAIDWCGNVIGFAQDGNVIELGYPRSDPRREITLCNTCSQKKNTRKSPRTNWPEASNTAPRCKTSARKSRTTCQPGNRMGGKRASH